MWVSEASILLARGDVDFAQSLWTLGHTFSLVRTKGLVLISLESLGITYRNVSARSLVSPTQ